MSSGAPRPQQPMALVLVGFMGAGKTTVGRLLAERLGLPFADSDVIIEERLGRTVREVFATDGEAYFREVEHRTVAELVQGQDAVISLGGGALGDPRTREVLRRARIVHLRVSYHQAMERVRSDDLRPMLRRPDVEDLYRGRLPVYQELAALTVETDGRRPGAVVDDVLAWLSGQPQEPDPSGASAK